MLNAPPAPRGFPSPITRFPLSASQKELAPRSSSVFLRDRPHRLSAPALSLSPMELKQTVFPDNIFRPGLKPLLDARIPFLTGEQPLELALTRQKAHHYDYCWAQAIFPTICRFHLQK